MILQAEQQQPRSLTELNGVVLPPEVSMTPTAPGWMLLGVTSALALGVIAAWLVQRRRALAYRRAALAELARIRSTGDVGELPVLLKRTALCVHSRSEVAALSGADWNDFLDRTGGRDRFQQGAGATLERLAYGSPPEPDAPEIETLLRAAQDWIRVQGPCTEVRA